MRELAKLELLPTADANRQPRSIQDASRHAQVRIAAIEYLALQACELAQMDYDFLFDESRHLLAIGYNVSERRRDASYYDLLASEARLGSFVAIAQGQLPQESWFALGRLLVIAGGDPTLLSWSGSMFEYLMPLLVMPTYENTLLDQTCRAAVARQIEYGKQRGVPWGVSESGYNTVDVHLNYQYRAFGVPGLGLKRGLAEDLVIAPYASALALMVAPEAACLNLQRLAAAGFTGQFGFYEAIDYTPSRLPRGQTSAVVRSFMAHHQGMSFLSLAYVLLDRPMQKRFESAPMFQATALLLQERIPKTPSFYSHTTGEITNIRTTASGQETSDAGLQQPQHPATGSAVVVEWPLPCDGHQRRWRLQSLERPRGDPLARRPDLRCRGARSVTSAMWPAASSGPPPISRRSSRRTATKRFSRKDAPSFAAATTRSSPIPRSWCRRKMTSNCAGCASPTAPGPAGSSKSPVTRKSFSPRRPPTRCIRRSAISLCRPRFSTRNRRFSALAARARGMNRRPGCFT